MKTRYQKLITQQNIVFASEIKPIYQRSLPEHTELIFTGVETEELQQYGEVVAPSLEDLFIAMNSQSNS